MFGFHDHVHRKSSGRPEPHLSWAAERFTTWVGWLGAVVFLFGAAYYYAKWQDAAGAGPMLLGSVLSAVIAYFRRRALEHKKAALGDALRRYETTFAEPYP